MKNIVVGVVFNDSSGNGWWIMADGSKLSGAKADEVLPILQAIESGKKSITLWHDCKYIFYGAVQNLMYVARRRIRKLFN